MKIKLDVEAMRAAGRTAGALMFGNAFIGYFVLEKRDLAMLVGMAAVGVITMVLNSLSYEDEVVDAGNVGNEES